jgi:stage V sporulation protein D (sporulation-specific penicillin-binding protein)
MMVALVLGIMIRLFYLQVWHNHLYHHRAVSQRLRVSPLPARRGIIYDRNYHELALTINAPGALALPDQIDDPASFASSVASLLDSEPEQIIDSLATDKGEVWLSRRLEPQEAEELKALGLAGLRVIERPERFYPNGRLAAPLLGIVGIDNQGLEGLEYQYDEILRGIPGRIARESDVAGRPIPGGTERLIPSQAGDSLVLTVDKVIQYIAERELAQAVEETGARQGAFIVMDPRTGELLAAAYYPSFDPQNYQAFSRRRHGVFTDQFEPGSTFKVFTAAAAMEEGIVDTHSLFYDRGHLNIGGITVRCWRPGGHGEQNFQQALENSCNTVFAQVAGELLSPSLFHRYLRNFGFGRRLNVDFPGEASGTLPAPGARWGEQAQWATIGFGQGIAVTPIQLLTAFCAVVNDGLLMQPRLVRQIISQEGDVLQEFGPVALRQVISPETATQLQLMLRRVVTNGSGGAADIKGFPVAGKTGTAEIPSPEGGYGEERIASFIGYAPFDDPRLAALVILYEPQTEVRFGGVLAAPVFAAGVADMLNYLQVPAREIVGDRRGGIGGELYPGWEKVSTNGQIVVPSLIGKSLREAVGVLAQVGLTIDIIGSGSVVQQDPPPGELVWQGTPVRVQLEFTPS